MPLTLIMPSHLSSNPLPSALSPRPPRPILGFVSRIFLNEYTPKTPHFVPESPPKGQVFVFQSNPSHAWAIRNQCEITPQKPIRFPIESPCNSNTPPWHPPLFLLKQTSIPRSTPSFRQKPESSLPNHRPLRPPPLLLSLLPQRLPLPPHLADMQFSSHDKY